jgi:hypothetical protein
LRLLWGQHAHVGEQRRRGAAAVRLEYRSSNGDAVDTTLDRVVLDELVGGLPVREFRWYRSRKHYSGWYWSSTTGGLVAYESLLELARIMLADFAPDVHAIVGQPFRLIGADGRRIRRHVPDILVVNDDGGVTIVDVKAPDKRDDPDVMALMRWTERTVGLRGWGFEEWYGAPPQRLANVRFLAGYRRKRLIAEDLIPAVQRAVPAGLTIADIERSVGESSPALVRPVVLHLLWTGELVADMTRPLDALTFVKLRDQKMAIT